MNHPHTPGPMGPKRTLEAARSTVEPDCFNLYADTADPTMVRLIASGLSEPDARLFAASAGLLASLEATEAELVAAYHDVPRNGAAACAIDNSLSRIRAAISKAKGGA